MGEWLKDFLEREAGHIVVAFFLLGMACIIHDSGMQTEARDLVMFSLGILGRSMGVAVARSGKGGAA